MCCNSSIEKSSFYIFFSLFFALNGMRGLGLKDLSLAAESSFFLYCWIEELKSFEFIPKLLFLLAFYSKWT